MDLGQYCLLNYFMKMVIFWSSDQEKQQQKKTFLTNARWLWEQIYTETVYCTTTISALRNWQGRTHRWVCQTPWAHLNFQRKSTEIQRTILEIVAFMYIYMILWTYQMIVLGSPKKNLWLRPQKHYVYCTLLLLFAGPEIATKHTGCPKKNRTGPYVHCEHNTLCMVNWLKKERRKKNKKKLKLHDEVYYYCRV